MKNFTQKMAVLLLAAGVAMMTACTKDTDSTPTCTVTWNLTLPDHATSGSLSDLKATFTNLNTGATYTNVTLNAATKATVVSLSALIPQGQYKVSVEGTLTYSASTGDQITTGVRAYKESVTLTGEQFDLPEMQMTFYSPSTGFVISEIFFAGTATQTGDQYGDDQYLKIYNNSDQVLYADSLAIVGSEFLTNQKRDYSPDIMSEFLSVDFVFMIPGSGKDVPVQPGKELLIAINGINHTEYNSLSFDLSRADFEFYDVSSNSYTDIDSPTVPNLDKWYSSTMSVTGLHNRGSQSYALARLNGTKEQFLQANKYTASYLFVYGDFQREMTLDTYKLSNTWIVDAVNCAIHTAFQWIVTDSALDNGWTWCAETNTDKARFNKAVRRKVASTSTDGRQVLTDTNNSTDDFEACATPSLLE